MKVTLQRSLSHKKGTYELETRLCLLWREPYLTLDDLSGTLCHIHKLSFNPENQLNFLLNYQISNFFPTQNSLKSFGLTINNRVVDSIVILFKSKSNPNPIQSKSNPSKSNSSKLNSNQIKILLQR